MEDPSIISPELTENICKTYDAAHACVTTNQDAVMRWLCIQWTAAMGVLPDTLNQNTTKDVLEHIGCIALTMERVGFKEFGPFQYVAAEMMKKFFLCRQADEAEQPAQSATIH